MSLLDPQLLAFSVIAKCHSVHAAADELHITQTAVTQRLKGLEQKLGVGLFVRSRRGMLLTAEGEVLLRYCQNAQALEGETLAQMQGAGTTNQVRVAIVGPTSVMQARVLPVVTEVTQVFPQLLCEMRYRDDDSASQLLKNGEVQLAILSQEHVAKELKHKTLAPEQYILVASKAWQKRKLKDIIAKERIIDFNPADMMTFNYLKYFDLFDAANHERHFADHPEAIASLVAKGRGYSVLEKSFVEPLIQKGELVMLNQGKQYHNPISVAWYDRPEMPDYLVEMINKIF